MRFLIDAQLPSRLALLLNRAGHDAIHTLELPMGTGRPTARSRSEQMPDSRIVVTKDRDFRDGHLLARSPQRLLVVATGTSPMTPS